MGEEKRKNELKIEDMNNNPDDYINVKDVVVCVQIKDGNISKLINIEHGDYFPLAKGLLDLDLPFANMHFVRLAEKAKKLPIIQPEK